MERKRQRQSNRKRQADIDLQKDKKTDKRTKKDRHKFKDSKRKINAQTYKIAEVNPKMQTKTDMLLYEQNIKHIHTKKKSEAGTPI